MDEAERVRRYTALVERTSDEAWHIWDKTCLTRPIETHMGRAATLAMYLRPGEIMEPEFAFFGHNEKIDFTALAAAICTLHLEESLWNEMAASDAGVAAAGGFKGDSRDSDYAEAIFRYVAANLHPHEGVPLPVAYVALETTLERTRRHLDFWCYDKVPMAPVWSLFRSRVMGGLLGL